MTTNFDPQTVVAALRNGDTVERPLLAGALGILGQGAANDTSAETQMDLEVAVAALSGDVSLVLEVVARQLRNNQGQPTQSEPDPLAGLAGMAPQAPPTPNPAPAQQPATPTSMPVRRASRAAAPR